MVNPAAGIREARFEIVLLQIRHLVEYLSRIETRGEKVEDIADTNPHAAHTRTASARFGIDGDTVE